MTKPQLIEALQAYGEHPAKTWTKVEIRARLLELQGRDVEPSQRELNSSTLELMTRELRKAAKQKSALVAYCTNELEMVLTGNETKPQLEMKAMKLILQKAPAEARDIVGFGRHSELRYIEIQAQHTEYCRWVMQTAHEGPNDCDPRLKRLAEWLESHPPTTGNPTKQELTEWRGTLPQKGYPTGRTPGTSSTAAPKSLVRPKGSLLIEKAKGAESNTSSPEVITDADKKLEDQAQKMEEMAAMLAQMQAEMNAMKSEPPRKQVAQSDEDSMTDRSFVAVKARSPRTGN